MSYKIYTYADPYKISQTDFWDEIKYYPQLCASRTLVNGLLHVMGDEIVSLTCPLDDIVNKRVFNDWTNNISLSIQQYTELGKIYRNWHNREEESKRLTDSHYDALVHNKNAMLDSVKLFIELGIKGDSLEANKLNMEHRVFVYLLKILEKNALFSLPQMPSITELKDLIQKQAEWEKEEKERLHQGQEDTETYRKEIRIIERMIESSKTWDGMHVVVHGIHQFTPLQLRFLSHLDKLGVEVIFIYNYLPEFKEIYSSWNYIYQQFDAPIYHDQNIRAYAPVGQLQKPGNAIACNMALLCEEGISRGDKRIRDNYELYEKEKVQEFDNVSEYAGYVSDLFAEAVKRLEEEQLERDKPFQKRPGTSSVLARMEDVIYTANKDVDTLLQVYYPEYARNRHFLAYPIGQFFVALYSLWNVEKKEIDMDFNLLRECVNSGIMSRYNAEQLLKTLMNLEPLFTDLSSYSEFKERFENYKRSYRMVENANQGSIAFPLRMINIYNSYKVPLKEIEDLGNAICELNDSAVQLFGDVETDEQFQFSSHFNRLKEFVSGKQASLANEEEKDLIEKLLIRLDAVEKQLQANDKGTLEDLKSGLYFFLKQKEEPAPDWFVKNFEQIDGDVLNSQNQNAPGKKKVYHFACVSDKDMNCRVDELLPWPISELFIERAYIPKELSFRVYYAALGERSNFLRYALFYGLYFSQCDTKISFVKRYGEDTTDYYGMLRLIGLQSTDGSLSHEVDDYYTSTVTRAKKVQVIKYEREQMAAMFLCPYRYLLDYVLNPQPILSGSFLIQKYLVNILIENTWKSIAGKDQKMVKENLSRFIDQEAEKVRGYFRFYRETEMIDLKKQAENYIISQVFKEDQSKVRECQVTHMQLKRTFGNAMFSEKLQDLPARHEYDAFERLAKVEEDKKSYSTHSVSRTEDKQLIECALKYINDSDSNMERVGSWCTYCTDKNICLEPFAQVRD